MDDFDEDECRAAFNKRHGKGAWDALTYQAVREDFIYAWGAAQQSMSAASSGTQEPFAYFQYNAGWKNFEQVVESAAGREGVIAAYRAPVRMPLSAPEGWVVEKGREDRFHIECPGMASVNASVHSLNPMEMLLASLAEMMCREAPPADLMANEATRDAAINAAAGVRSFLERRTMVNGLDQTEVARLNPGTSTESLLAVKDLWAMVRLIELLN